ncbi:MAG: hypothetical protein HYZ42_13745, partial [Bacteroidetes bacterium]|nr:hypothetical protein [Bacteroidota bacterium]
LLSLKEVLFGDQSREKIKKYIIYTVSIVGGICAIFILLPGLFLDFTNPSDSQIGIDPKLLQNFLQSIQDDRETMTRMSAIRSLILIGLSITVVWFFLLDKIKKEVVIVLLGMMILFDLYSIDRKHLNNDSFVKKSSTPEQAIVPSAADAQILADRDPNYRVLSFDVSPFNDATVSFFHKNIGGYHGAKFRRYQELRERYFDQPIGMVQQNVRSIPATFLLDTMQKMKQLELFNMMNTKYFIANGEAIPNKYAYGNAWLVNNICWVKNADQEIDTLKNLNLKEVVVIDEKFKDKIGTLNSSATDSSSFIKLILYSQP